MPAKVLFIADIDSKSHNLKWISRLSQEVECHVVCLSHQIARSSDSHLTYLKNNLFKSINSIDPVSFIRFFRLFKDLIILKRIVKQKKIDLIHVMYAEPNALWGIFRVFLGVPMILTTRGSDVLSTLVGFEANRNIHYRILFGLFKLSFRKFDYITCTSQTQSRLMKRWTKRKDVIVVRTGVDIGQVPKLEELPEHKYILCPRSIYPLYNHELAMKAYSMLSDELRQTYKLIFLGSDTQDQKYFSYLVDYQKELKIDCTFYKSQSPAKFYHYLQHASLVVMTPLADGSPVSAMEAMFLKIPVILPPLDYDEDLFKDKAFFFEQRDAKSLAMKIEQVLQLKEDELNSRLSLAQSAVIEHADFGREMRKIVGLYNSLIR